jgi:tRNA(fMet)-specific endonuclease VapC
MSLWVFDTDIATHLFHGHSKVAERVSEHPMNELAISVVSVEEMLGGWYTQIRRAKTDQKILNAYLALLETVEFIKQLQTLPFDEAALLHFQTLKGMKLRIGTNDLRIASVALAQQAILVTRNQPDFAAIPGLVTEDWTI